LQQQPSLLQGSVWIIIFRKINSPTSEMASPAQRVLPGGPYPQDFQNKTHPEAITVKEPDKSLQTIYTSRNVHTGNPLPQLADKGSISLFEREK
jgi:hypothetical protein